MIPASSTPTVNQYRGLGLRNIKLVLSLVLDLEQMFLSCSFPLETHKRYVGNLYKCRHSAASLKQFFFNPISVSSLFKTSDSSWVFKPIIAVLYKLLICCKSFKTSVIK